MNPKKKALLQKHGWKTGDTGDFLRLSPEERLYVEMKAALAHSLYKLRGKRRMTQKQLALLLRSSQSRIAKMEKNDSSVSLDLLIRSLIAMGAVITKSTEADGLYMGSPAKKQDKPSIEVY